MSNWAVDDERPEWLEDHESSKLHSFCESTDDQRRCDDREHHLESHERLLADSNAVGIHWEPIVLEGNVLEHQVGRGVAHESTCIVWTESKTKADNHPKDADHELRSARLLPEH